MDSTRLRRTGALLASAALLASLTVATVAAPTTAARPKCDGKVATIVSYKKVIRGTSRADVIVAKGRKNNKIYGNGGRDRICAGKGNDFVNGGPGPDRIFGGSGRDRLLGKRGNDDIFGFVGDDLIFGGGNNDFINGGAGSDECFQGSGTGPIKNCEVADLSIEVVTPASVPQDADEIVFIPVEVFVTNGGPDTVTYLVKLYEEDQGLSDCTDGSWNLRKFGPIANGEVDKIEYQASCLDSFGPGGWIEVFGEVTALADDPVLGNDKDDSFTTVE
jgi:hypothetical protein